MSLHTKRPSFKTKYKGVKAIKPTMKDLLTEVLAAHQQVCVARVKEVQAFDTPFFPISQRESKKKCWRRVDKGRLAFY